MINHFKNPGCVAKQFTGCMQAGLFIQIRDKIKNHCLFVISCILVFFSCLCSSSTKPSIQYDYQGAVAMLKVIQAIHDQQDKDTVERLLDHALELEAYQICNERYNNPGRAQNNRVPLSQYKKFMLSLLGDSVDTQGNRRIGFLKDLYVDAVKNPKKYGEAVERVKSITDSRIQKSLETALHWLPEGIEINANIIVLFDIGGGAWIQQTGDGRNHTGFNILLLLDENDKFDQGNFLGTLAHELHHIGIPVERYFDSIRYESLEDTSRLKIYTEYIRHMITEGLAQKFCSNAPGRLSSRPYPEKKFAAIERARQNWTYFMSEFEDIHKRAIDDLNRILKDKVNNPEEFMSAYTNYWTWHAGRNEKKDFVLGRRYYYGSELLGVINDGLGREALFEVIYDFRNLLPLYNEGLMTLKPEGYRQYLFPEDLVNRIRKL